MLLMAGENSFCLPNRSDKSLDRAPIFHARRALDAAANIDRVRRHGCDRVADISRI
jgi:hypothetical protein